MGLFDKDEKETADEIKLQLADLAVKLARVREQVGKLNEERQRLFEKASNAKSESDELAAYAAKALKAGNEQDARAFLNEKYRFDEAYKEHSGQLGEVNQTRNKAIELHDKMVREINEARTRLAVLSARNATADAQIKASQTVGSYDFEMEMSQLESEAETRTAMADAKRYSETGE